MICPCKDCDKRYEACHDNCEDYISWNTKRLAAKNNYDNNRINEMRFFIMRKELAEKHKKKLHIK